MEQLHAFIVKFVEIWKKKKEFYKEMIGDKNKEKQIKTI